MNTSNSYSWFHKENILLLIGVLIVVLIISFSSGIRDVITSAIEFLGSIAASRPVLGMATYVGISAFAAVLSFFSSAPLIPIALVAWGPIATVILTLSGWILGGVISYTLAYYFGQPLVKKIISKEKYTHYSEFLLQKISFNLIVLFRLAVPSEIGGILLGVIRYPFGKYLLATLISELPFAIVLTYAGDAFIKQKFGSVAIYIVAITIAVAVFGYLLHREYKKNNE